MRPGSGAAQQGIGRNYPADVSRSRFHLAAHISRLDARALQGADCRALGVGEDELNFVVGVPGDEEEDSLVCCDEFGFGGISALSEKVGQAGPPRCDAGCLPSATAANLGTDSRSDGLRLLIG